MSQRALAALKRWRAFATTLTLNVGGEWKTWEEYTKGNGYVDEERIVQPTAFPAFALQCLDWTLQVNLAPEEGGAEGKPDFTPADSVTHPFVFETKSTKKGVELTGDEPQVLRYLTEGAPRIKTVLLTNLVGARVFTLDHSGALHLNYEINLRGLLLGSLDMVAKFPQAEKLADLFDEFSRKELKPEEKLAKVRSAPPWNPLVEVTSSQWILGRIDRVVALLTSSVIEQIRSGTLQGTSSTSGDERKWITDELRLLAARLGESAEKNTLQDAALHPDIRVVAQPRRGVLRDHHPASHPARILRQRHRTGHRNRLLHNRLERPLPAVHMDQDGRRDPAPRHP